MKLKILGVFILAVIIEGLIFFFSSQKKNEKIITAPVPSISAGIDKNYGDSFTKILPQIEKANSRATLIGELLSKLPYSEALFSLSYNYDADVFSATISSSDKNGGLSRLDAFLKQNKIESRDWITNLEIVYK